MKLGLAGREQVSRSSDPAEIPVHARYAQLTEASIHLSVLDGQCRLQIVDNGHAIDSDEPNEGGVVDLRRRAENLEGSLDVETLSTGGTVLTWQVSIAT